MTDLLRRNKRSLEMKNIERVDGALKNQHKKLCWFFEWYQA